MVENKTKNKLDFIAQVAIISTSFNELLTSLKSNFFLMLLFINQIT